MKEAAGRGRGSKTPPRGGRRREADRRRPPARLLGGVGGAGTEEFLGRRLRIDLRLRLPRALDRLGAILGGHHVLDLELLLRSEEHTSELQSLMRISYAVFCLKK